MSVDLRSQDSESLKRDYGLKLLYLVKEENPLFTECYANGKDVIVCGHDMSM